MLVKLAKSRHLAVEDAAALAAEAGRKYIDCYTPEPSPVRAAL